MVFGLKLTVALILFLIHYYNQFIMNYRIIKSRIATYIVIHLFLMGISLAAFSQSPIITSRFANPDYDVATEQYCVDVEFISDATDSELFGMNVRFFYDDNALELIGFSDFQGGYGAVIPNPPYVNTFNVGPAFFGFTGAAEFVNGAIQIVDNSASPIILERDNWTKIFQICFNVDDPDPDVESFCPSLVWDLEQNPANGGYLTGDEGVVIIINQPDPGTGTAGVTENVDQFNWAYTGTGASPFGHPVQEACTEMTGPFTAWITMNCPSDVALECDESISPSALGAATVEDNCEAEPVIAYTDEITEGSCANNYSIVRTWSASNECGMSATCTQILSVSDTKAPEILGVPEKTCVGDPLLNDIIATDNCGDAYLIFTETIIANPYGPGKAVKRVYQATDECGNTSSATVIIQKKGACKSENLMNPGITDLSPTVSHDEIALPSEVSEGNREVKDFINQISLWPNPSNEIVNVSFESTMDQQVTLSIMNFLGNIVYNEQIKPGDTNHTQSISVTHLPPGSYVVLIQSAKEIYSKTFIITDHN